MGVDISSSALASVRRQLALEESGYSERSTENFQPSTMPYKDPRDQAALNKENRQSGSPDWGKYAGYAATALNLTKFSNPYAAALGIAAPIAINYYLNKRDPHKKKMEAQMAMQESAMMNLLGKQKAQAQATQLTPAQRAALNRAGQTVAGRGGAGTQKFLQYGVEAQAPGLIEQTRASGAAGMTQTSAALDRIVGRRKLMSDQYRQSVAGVGKEVARFVMPELTSVVDATAAAKGGEGMDFSSIMKLIELVGKKSTTPTT